MSNSYVEVVEQAISLLDDISLDDYKKVASPHFSSSIGTHIRHIIDHFLALKEASQLLGVGSAKTHGSCEQQTDTQHDDIQHRDMHTAEVNYNKRNRHGEVEHCPKAAIVACQDISTWLRTMCSNHLLNIRLQVTTEIDISHTKSTTCESTLERELVFVASHAIHHYALIRIIRNMQGMDLPEFFGFAPATITHLTRSA